MAVWLVRAGKHGENEVLALEKSIVVVGWTELPELSTVGSREQMKAHQAKHNPECGEKHVINNAAQNRMPDRGCRPCRPRLPAPEEADALLECWRYDPCLFAPGGIVDGFSLYLSLADSADERVRLACAELLEG